MVNASVVNLKPHVQFYYVLQAGNSGEILTLEKNDELQTIYVKSRPLQVKMAVQLLLSLSIQQIVFSLSIHNNLPAV